MYDVRIVANDFLRVEVINEHDSTQFGKFAWNPNNSLISHHIWFFTYSE